MNREFIPDNDRSFLSWVINFLKYLFQALARVGFPEEKGPWEIMSAIIP
jgi:hypothetical protein